MASSATPLAGQADAPKQSALNAAFAKLMSWSTVKSLTAGGEWTSHKEDTLLPAALQKFLGLGPNCVRGGQRVRSPEVETIFLLPHAGIAGATAKTVVAPLERVKILFQVHNERVSIMSSVRTILKEVRAQSHAPSARRNMAVFARTMPPSPRRLPRNRTPPPRSPLPPLLPRSAQTPECFLPPPGAHAGGDPVALEREYGSVRARRSVLCDTVCELRLFQVAPVSSVTGRRYHKPQTLGRRLRGW